MTTATACQRLEQARRVNTARRVRTARLLLRRPTTDDLDAVIRIHGDPLTNRFNPAGPTSAGEAGRKLRGWIDHWERLGFGYWAASTLESTGRVIGFGGVMEKQVGPRYGLNLYFRFAPEAWQRGYATELGRAALDLAFHGLGCDRVLASTRVSNLPSRRTLERLGLRAVQEHRDDKGKEASAIYVLERPGVDGTEEARPG